MSWTTSTHIDIKRRGLSIPDGQREIVERLRSQAFAVQKRFGLAENSALILEQMLGDEEDDVGTVVDDTYEAHTFCILRTQLYRMLIIDLSAGVLDKNLRTGSVRSILKELQRDSKALDALRAYYSDPTCLEVSVEGEGVDAEFLERQRATEIERSSQESIESIDNSWVKIEKESSILQSDNAKRMVWARHKATAHFERTATGIVALEDHPPCGTGKLTWDEPIRFFSAVRPFVYEVYYLVTATRWDSSHTDISRFYAKAFWDRFKNGRTELEP